jgi:endogenous inhibitor of DNA gyrase (YacG/DUF329 family)
MPQAQKTCPRCGTQHQKRGPFCSRSCGNVREHTEDDKAARSQKLTEYHQTPEGAATREKSSRIMSAKRKGEDWEEVGVDDYAVGIPDVTDYSADYDDTWQRAEKW